MVVVEFLAGLLRWVAGSPEQATLAAAVLLAGHHLRSAAAIGQWLRFAGVGSMILAGLLLFGVISLDAGLLAGLLDVLTSLLLP